MLIIQANNIHESGAKSLLLSLLTSARDLYRNSKVVVFLDERLISTDPQYFSVSPDFDVVSVRPTIFGRFMSEVKIWRLARRNADALLLCFGNLPPLFPCRTKTVVYFQTVLYFRRFSKYVVGVGATVKFNIELIWIKFRLGTVDRIFVQSKSVKDGLCREFKINSNVVEICPFLNLKELVSDGVASKSSGASCFFYPALGTPHKNHKMLIQAWVNLAKENIYPILILTLDSRYKNLLQYLDAAMTSDGIKVVNIGVVPRSEVLRQLKSSTALIFPSLCESFGLPLVEAKENNIPILAAESDYVRDLVVPAESFDPNSALSISRAVKRFLNTPEWTPTIKSSDSFLRSLSEFR